MKRKKEKLDFKDEVTTEELNVLFKSNQFAHFYTEFKENDRCKIGLFMYKKIDEDKWKLISDSGIKTKAFRSILKPVKDRGRNYYG